MVWQFIGVVTPMRETVCTNINGLRVSIVHFNEYDFCDNNIDRVTWILKYFKTCIVESLIKNIIL